MSSYQRKLSSSEIDSILNAIKPNLLVPKDIADAEDILIKKQLRKQLIKVKIYPEMIDDLKSTILLHYQKSRVNPGETVGLLASQSIGEPTTQMSIGFNELIEIRDHNNITKIYKIGILIDDLMEKIDIISTGIKDSYYAHVTEPIYIKSVSVKPSSEGHYFINWRKITQISRHLPMGGMMKIVTENNKKVTTTLSHSHLTQDNKGMIVPIRGDMLRIGDKVPVFIGTSSIEWEKIKEIILIDYEDKYVYDFTVETDNNFLVNESIFVHNTLNTFHMAGVSDKNVTLGVPKFNEILNATSKPKAVNCFIYLNNKPSSLKEVDKIIGSSLKEIRLIDLLSSYDVIQNKTPEWWYVFHSLVYNSTIDNSEWCLEFKIDSKSLFDSKISLRDVANKIEETYDDLQCIVSPLELFQIDVYVDTTNIDIDDQLFYLNAENKESYYIHDIVVPTLNNLMIDGIEGVKGVYYKKENDEWMIETDGGIMNNLFMLDVIDKTRTVSNNMWDIYSTLGIEAAREFLCQEVKSILSFDGTYIDQRHINLLVDMMTFSGTILAVSRYGIQRDQVGPLAKVSFEESFDNFLKAGLYGEDEIMMSVSSAIMCGRKAKIGTQLCEIMIDVEQFNREDETPNTQDSDNDIDNLIESMEKMEK